jgi:hypothetical protein
MLFPLALRRELVFKPGFLPALSQLIDVYFAVFFVPEFLPRYALVLPAVVQATIDNLVLPLKARKTQTAQDRPRCENGKYKHKPPPVKVMIAGLGTCFVHYTGVIRCPLLMPP